jgi:hypothetical protein
MILRNYFYKKIFDSSNRIILKKKKLLISRKIVNNFRHIQFHSFGKKNKNKIFYIIQRKIGGGLFSNVLYVLNHLVICDKLKLIPIVDMQNFEGFYNEKSKINQSLNAWEYYFKQVSNYKLKDVYKSKNVIISGNNTFKNYKLRAFKKYKDIYKSYKKYISINQNIHNEMNKIYYNLKINKKDTVGLHWRGTDHKFLPNHPQPPTRNQIFSKIDGILLKKKKKKIFLVTEDSNYLKIIKKRYGKKVKYLDSFRSSKSSDFSNFKRKDHRYKIGKESLIETLILSKLDHLVCSESNISDFAKFISKNKNFFIDRIVNKRNGKSAFICFLKWKVKTFLPSFLGGY